MKSWVVKNLLPWCMLILLLITGHYLFPWWIVAVICWVWVFAFRIKNRWSILVAGITAGTIWVVTAFRLSTLNEHILLQRMANMFELSNMYLLFLMVFLLAALPAMLATFAALLLRNTLKL
jgi:hypothetical protein